MANEIQTIDENGSGIDSIPIRTYEPMLNSLLGAVALAEAEGRIITELSLSCDELQNCLEVVGSSARNATSKAQIISRRVSALKELANRLDTIQDRQRHSAKVQVIAMVVRLMKESMREAGVPNESRELIVQNLAMKLEEEEQQEKRDKKKAG